MPRRDNRNNPLNIRIVAGTLPKSVTPHRYLTRLLEHIRTGRALPPKWEVTVYWQNPNSRGITRIERGDDFESVVSESRSGFVEIMARMIERRLRHLEEE